MEYSVYSGNLIFENSFLFCNLLILYNGFFDSNLSWTVVNRNEEIIVTKQLIFYVKPILNC